MQNVMVNGNTIHGAWLSSSRPDFFGMLTSFCAGTITFPDDQTYQFVYDELSCTITWDFGGTWQKPGCSQGKIKEYQTTIKSQL